MFKRPPDESLLKLLERLAGEGYLQNNRRLDVHFGFSCSSRFVEVICSMKNLESLDLDEDEIAADVLAHVFQSCSKLTNLHTATYDYKTLEMDERLKNKLRLGFQKLRCLRLYCFIDEGWWPVIQEMLT
jgi:hypothetical protein